MTSPSFEYELTAPGAPGWMRAELFEPDLAEQRKALCDNPETTYCRNMLTVTAMTSAMYVRGKKPAKPKPR